MSPLISARFRTEELNAYTGFKIPFLAVPINFRPLRLQLQGHCLFVVQRIPCPDESKSVAADRSVLVTHSEAEETN
jgi:hypothetical protein